MKFSIFLNWNRQFHQMSNTKRFFFSCIRICIQLNQFFFLRLEIYRFSEQCFFCTVLFSTKSNQVCGTEKKFNTELFFLKNKLFINNVERNKTVHILHDRIFCLCLLLGFLDILLLLRLYWHLNKYPNSFLAIEWKQNCLFIMIIKTAKAQQQQQQMFQKINPAAAADAFFIIPESRS